MPNKVVLCFVFSIVLAGAVAFAQNTGGSPAPSTDWFNWDKNGPLAVIYAIIAGVFQVIGFLYSNRSNPETVELRTKVDQLVAEVKTLIPNSGALQEILFCLKDLQVNVHERGLDVGEFSIKVNRAINLIEQVSDIQRKTDSDGVPLIYTPRSWHETQRDIVTMLNQLAVNQRDLIEIVRSK